MQHSQRVADAGTGADHRRLRDAEFAGDLIGALETDAADVARQAVRILRDQPDRIGTVGLEDAHRPQCADAVAVQKDHDLADRLLIGPGGDNVLGALRSDAVDLPQTLGGLFDGVEHLFAEGLHQLPGVDRADALDHSRSEILLDALGRRRRRRTQEVGAELHAVRPIVDPPATRLDELAGADRRRMTDDGNQIALAARLHPQHAEAVVLVVEGHALDEAGQVFARRLSGRWWLHYDPGARRQARRASSAAAPCVPDLGQRAARHAMCFLPDRTIARPTGSTRCFTPASSATPTSACSRRAWPPHPAPRRARSSSQRTTPSRPRRTAAT